MLGVLDGRHDGYYQKGDTAITWVFGHILMQAAPDAYGEEFSDFGNIEALPVIPDIWKMEENVHHGRIQPVQKQAVARNEDDICPTCKEGRLRQRGFKENPEKRYWGCSRFPECKHFEWVK